MVKELPLNLNIQYSGMVRDRNRLVAIMSEPSNRGWYAENFIPLLLYPNGNIHCYDTTNSYEIFNIYDQVIEKFEIRNISIEAIKKEIDINRYVIALVDEYYLPECVYYHLTHKFQEVLVYGYDSNKGVFLFHGSQVDKKDYGCATCTYEEFNYALISSCEKISEIESIEWKMLFGHPLSSIRVKRNNEEINLRKIYYHFSNLLSGKKIAVTKGGKTELFYAGICIFDELILRFDLIRNNDDTSYERAIWCIKLLAGYISSYKNIIALLDKQFDIRFDSELCNEIDLISQNITSIYSLLQKYIITGKDRNIDRAKETMVLVKGKIEVIWKIFVGTIQDYLDL